MLQLVFYQIAIKGSCMIAAFAGIRNTCSNLYSGEKKDADIQPKIVHKSSEKISTKIKDFWGKVTKQREPLLPITERQITEEENSSTTKKVVMVASAIIGSLALLGLGASVIRSNVKADLESTPFNVSQISAGSITNVNLLGMLGMPIAQLDQAALSDVMSAIPFIGDGFMSEPFTRASDLSVLMLKTNALGESTYSDFIHSTDIKAGRLYYGSNINHSSFIYNMNNGLSAIWGNYSEANTIIGNNDNTITVTGRDSGSQLSIGYIMKFDKESFSPLYQKEIDFGDSIPFLRSVVIGDLVIGFSSTFDGSSNIVISSFNESTGAFKVFSKAIDTRQYMGLDDIIKLDDNTFSLTFGSDNYGKFNILNFNSDITENYHLSLSIPGRYRINVFSLVQLTSSNLIISGIAVSTQVGGNPFFSIFNSGDFSVRSFICSSIGSFGDSLKVSENNIVLVGSSDSYNALIVSVNPNTGEVYKALKLRIDGGRANKIISIQLSDGNLIMNARFDIRETLRHNVYQIEMSPTLEVNSSYPGVTITDITDSTTFEEIDTTITTVTGNDWNDISEAITMNDYLGPLTIQETAFNTTALVPKEIMGLTITALNGADIAVDLPDFGDGDYQLTTGTGVEWLTVDTSTGLLSGSVPDDFNSGTAVVDFTGEEVRTINLELVAVKKPTFDIPHSTIAVSGNGEVVVDETMVNMTMPLDGSFSMNIPYSNGTKATVTTTLPAGYNVSTDSSSISIEGIIKTNGVFEINLSDLLGGHSTAQLISNTVVERSLNALYGAMSLQIDSIFPEIINFPTIEIDSNNISTSSTPIVVPVDGTLIGNTTYTAIGRSVDGSYGKFNFYVNIVQPTNPTTAHNYYLIIGVIGAATASAASCCCCLSLSVAAGVATTLCVSALLGFGGHLIKKIHSSYQKDIKPEAYSPGKTTQQIVSPCMATLPKIPQRPILPSIPRNPQPLSLQRTGILPPITENPQIQKLSFLQRTGTLPSITGNSQIQKLSSLQRTVVPPQNRSETMTKLTQYPRINRPDMSEIMTKLMQDPRMHRPDIQPPFIQPQAPKRPLDKGLG